MPYANEHAARMHDPKDYTSFARKTIAPGVDVIYGIKEGKSEVQAYRFAKEKFNAVQAQTWLKEHKLEPMMFEPAASKKNDAVITRAVHRTSIFTV